jgi:small subunit ribosomal protein S6
MEKKKQNLYEGMFIVSASLTDDARQRAFDKIVTSITTQGGEIVKLHDQGRRRLAYPIGGKRDGHYYLLYFKVDPVSMTKLWQDFHHNEDLMRFMTLATEVVMEEIKFKTLVEQ